MATLQSLSGTGSLRVAAEFIAKFLPGKTAYLSNPTWGNHKVHACYREDSLFAQHISHQFACGKHALCTPCCSTVLQSLLAPHLPEHAAGEESGCAGLSRQC